MVFGDTLSPNNMSYRVMLGNLSFTFDCPAKCKAVKILTNMTTLKYLKTVSLVGRLTIRPLTWLIQGRIQDFKLGGGALRKIVPSGGRRENVWGISCEKSRFYAKKSYFSQLRREARKFWGYFVWKITILRQKIYFFPILGGARAGCAPPPPGSAPVILDFF
jgi:hypothetical protein